MESLHIFPSIGQTDGKQYKANVAKTINHHWKWLAGSIDNVVTMRGSAGLVTKCIVNGGRIAAMRRNRRNNTKKERIIMIASSAFVLSALTLTGIYMKSDNAKEQDDGYMLDFTAMEDSAQDKFQEIAQNDLTEDQVDTGLESQGMDIAQELENLEDDLDYLPMEAGSGLVTIPGLTDGISDEALEDAGLGALDVPVNDAPELPAKEKPIVQESVPTEEPAADETDSTEAAQEQESTSGDGVIIETLHFAESDGLLRPVSGEVLIPFSMDGSVYFSTLDQFKYNDAVVIASEEGSAVVACAEGTVIDIFENEEIGHAITMDLGDNYRITYGQLEGINVTLGSHVSEGETIAVVAAPTKYFAVEGSNLYLKLTANENPVNPETLFR